MTQTHTTGSVAAFSYLWQPLDWIMPPPVSRLNKACTLNLIIKPCLT
jgi:hypothetical protein